MRAIFALSRHVGSGVVDRVGVQCDIACSDAVRGALSVAGGESRMCSIACVSVGNEQPSSGARGDAAGGGGREPDSGVITRSRHVNTSHRKGQLYNTRGPPLAACPVATETAAL